MAFWRPLAQGSLLVGAAMLVRERAKSQSVAHTSSPPVGKKVELAVKMHCESCSNQVRRAILDNHRGVTGVEIDLANETVVVNGSFVTNEVVRSLEQAGREARVVGTGALTSINVPQQVGQASDGLVAAVVEFKGPVYGHGAVLGVVRLVQVGASDVAVEVDLDGLLPGEEYALRVHEFGDTRRPLRMHVGKPVADVVAKQTASLQGGIKSSGGVLLHNAFVWEWIGRSLVVDRLNSDKEEDDAWVAAVVARSAGVGDNSKKRLCTCDGTVIWEAKY